MELVRSFRLNKLKIKLCEVQFCNYCNFLYLSAFFSCLFACIYVWLDPLNFRQLLWCIRLVLLLISSLHIFINAPCFMFVLEIILFCAIRIDVIMSSKLDVVWLSQPSWRCSCRWCKRCTSKCSLATILNPRLHKAELPFETQHK